jgi:predicted permease
MRDELDFHVRERADALAAQGTAPDEALRRSRLEFGTLERWQEQCREAQGAGYVDETSRHVRDAWRSARREPGFVTIALLSLSLGIGANVAVFAIVDQLLLRPLPVRAPQELKQLVLSSFHGEYYSLSYPKYSALREQFPLFTTLFGWGAYGSGGDNKVDVDAGNRTIKGALTLVTGTFFDGLGVQPALGRLITPADDRLGGAANVAVLSYGTWQRMFGADPAVLGRTIKLDRLAVQVIGVTPPEFAGAEPADPADVYLPIYAMQPTEQWLTNGPGAMWMHVMGRLKPDVPVEMAKARLWDGWAQVDKADQPRRGDNTRPETMVLEDGSQGYSQVRIGFSRPVLVLMALVGIIFLIACGNIATLLFVRASRQRGELAVRIALGAGPDALVRQWMVECLLLALVGGLAGLLAARWISDVLLQFVPEVNRDALRLRIGPELVLFATGLSVAAAGIFGWLPTRRASRIDPNDVLRAIGPAGPARRVRVAELVLGGQLAASLVLVVGALLFAQTLWHLNHQNTGYERETVVYATPDLWGAGYAREQATEAMRRIMERTRSSPLFVRAATGRIPSEPAGGWGWVRVPGYGFAADEDNIAINVGASPGYFGTVSIPLLAGRDFVEGDAETAVVIVSQKLARHYFGNPRSAIGKQIAMGPAKALEIVGVVADIIDDRLRSGVKEIVYWPASSTWPSTILARVAPGVNVQGAEVELRATISAFTKAKPVPVKSGRLEDAVQESLRDDKLVGELSVALGLLGVFLASIGLFGAVAHWAAGRTREIAIRLTLGATPGHIAGLVIRRGLAVIGLGVAAGVPAAMAAATLIQPLLFGVTPRDTLTLTTAVAILVAVGLLAACWPARRAMRVNALEVLRWE